MTGEATLNIKLVKSGHGVHKFRLGGQAHERHNGGHSYQFTDGTESRADQQAEKKSASLGIEQPTEAMKGAKHLKPGSPTA